LPTVRRYETLRNSEHFRIRPLPTLVKCCVAQIYHFPRNVL
jgi:hypothetical protein